MGSLRNLSLRWRLSLAFAGMAILTAGVIGAILIPILSNHYRTAEKTYLEAAAERAVRDLGSVQWKKDSAGLDGIVAELAQVTQARVKVTDQAGAVVADSGSPVTTSTVAAPPPAGQQTTAPQALPDPLGGGLFASDSSTASAPRSDQTIRRPVERNGRLQGYVEVSEAPGYARAALINTAKAWGLAGAVGVIIAALVGWLFAWRLTRPISRLIRATDRMSQGDLSARAGIERGDEVGRLARSFDTMAARNEATVTSLRRFVADAAHEIGTPLTALQADLDIAQSNPQQEKRERFVEHAAGQARRLEHLTSNLLRLSRLETQELAQEPAPVDLCALAAQVLDSVASRADQAEIDLRAEIARTPVWVLGYADKLETAVANLVDNALKFTPAGGTVTLGVEQRDDRVEVWVADTGIGIPPEESAQLFERFHRGRNVHAYAGSGLGLAIVKATADLHRGTISARPNDCDGARFALVLPALPPTPGS